METNDISMIIPTRNFNMTYIVLDCLFIIFLIVLLAVKKKYLTLLWAIFGGILYLIVDFGIFYSITHTREISIDGQVLDGFGHFLVLFWLSFSYGVPNFIFIWMALGKDKHFWLFTFLIVGWWLVVPTLSQIGNMSALNGTFLASKIVTKRLTGDFHWIMGLFLVIGYGFLITYYLINDKENLKANVKTIIFLNIIGFATQMMWELPLLINGIRPLNSLSIQTLLVNSCIETNSGMVYFYLLHKFVTQKKCLGENLKIQKIEIKF